MKLCQDCIYYDTGTCRFNAPSPGAGAGDAEWPAVHVGDWCADGYNATDGWYDPAPRKEPK